MSKQVAVNVLRAAFPTGISGEDFPKAVELVHLTNGFEPPRQNGNQTPQLELTTTEARVYKALQQAGTATATELARQTGIAESQVYKALPRFGTYVGEGLKGQPRIWALKKQ